MDETVVYSLLTGIFHEILERDDLVLTPQLSAKDVEGWDSFKMIEIIIATEERFAIKLSTKEIDRLECVGDLAAVVSAKARSSP